MDFFNSAVDVLQTLVIALGAGLGVWGAVNMLEGYGNDNPDVRQIWCCIFDVSLTASDILFSRRRTIPMNKETSPQNTGLIHIIVYS